MPEKENEKMKKQKSYATSAGNSKAGSRGSGPNSYDELPGDFSFLWSIDAIETLYHEPYYVRNLRFGGRGNDIAKVWFPPNRTTQFRIIKTGDLYRWKDEEGDCEKLVGVQRPQEAYALISICFQSRQNNFLATDADCTRENIIDSDYGWSFLGFNHRGERLSEVDLCQRAEYEELAAPAGLPRTAGANCSPTILVIRCCRIHSGAAASAGRLTGQSRQPAALGLSSAERSPPKAPCYNIGKCVM